MQLQKTFICLKVITCSNFLSMDFMKLNIEKITNKNNSTSKVIITKVDDNDPPVFWSKVNI